MVTRRPLALVSGGFHEFPGSDTVPAEVLPLVLVPPVTLAYAATLAVDATDGNYLRCALTGNVTGWSFSGGVDGQKLLIRFTATAARTVDLSSLTKLSFIDDSLPVNTGAPAYAGFICDGTNSWTCISAGPVG